MNKPKKQEISDEKELEAAAGGIRDVFVPTRCCWDGCNEKGTEHLINGGSLYYCPEHWKEANKYACGSYSWV